MTKRKMINKLYRRVSHQGDKNYVSRRARREQISDECQVCLGFGGEARGRALCRFCDGDGIRKLEVIFA